MRKMMAVLPLVFVLLLVAGCAKPPQEAINAATAAIDAAKQAGAADYAADSLRAVEDAKAALDAELKAQEDKFALFRSYKKTDELVADLKAKADKAAADAKAALEKAPKGKGTAADLEAMKADLTAAESSIGEANAAMGKEDFKGAKAKADAATTSIQNVSSQIQAAIEAKKSAAHPAGHAKHK